MKRIPKREKTTLEINKSVIGDSIEVMIEKLMEGEGEGAIEDRDLVYNDNETDTVNPITNIRSDKMELLLDEKIGKYNHQHKKVAPKEEKEETSDNNDDNAEN